MMRGRSSCWRQRSSSFSDSKPPRGHRNLVHFHQPFLRSPSADFGLAANGAKKKTARQLRLTEPFHLNFCHYSKPAAIFTSKNRGGKILMPMIRRALAPGRPLDPGSHQSDAHREARHRRPADHCIGIEDLRAKDEHQTEIRRQPRSRPCPCGAATTLVRCRPADTARRRHRGAGRDTWRRARTSLGPRLPARWRRAS